MYQNASHGLFYLKTEFAKIVVGKARIIDGFHGNWRNYLIYVYYQYITCNFLVVNAGNVRLRPNGSRCATPICKLYTLANMHVHDYVKHYDWFWGKLPIVLLRFSLLSAFLYIWKSFDLFIIFRYHFKLTEISCVHCLDSVYYWLIFPK